ncbi:MAG: CRISPR-Cas system related protein, RAMP superfamily Cas7 group [Candidatus Methanohalarchaeum thermophilum]|uniref:CRISPR-Cas system related protein, RAMP superfamily Cas7 group n=1 Tax=Methanohalarchaeum thermophilum TaxID=1903181 RepID=A0A1Q6DVB2_METT1|nr:MAG: CRISPR-Cas system related protein, RAMP superfamily Cas7 group [Candidatus Methanohalarchaeum thermophilum]
MGYDFYSGFSNDKRKNVDWSKTRKMNLCLTTKQKITSLYKNKDVEEGKDRLKDIVNNSEFYFKNNQKYFLNPSNKYNSELLDRKDMLESLIDDDNKFSFELKKPLLTNGEKSFYIHANPIAKEKVFKVPMIRASSIKGNLRFVAVRIFVEKLGKELSDIKKIFKRRTRLAQIFGNEKDGIAKYLNRKIAELKENKEPNEVGKEFKEYLKDKGYYKDQIENRRGRLQFYPLFFEDIGLEVITPIDRETGTAKHPIQLEKIPRDTKGELKLYYYPFDILGENKEEQKEKDIEIIVNSLYEMLTKHGIGAKTSDGYGLAKQSSLPKKEQLKEDLLNE